MDEVLENLGMKLEAAAASLSEAIYRHAEAVEGLANSMEAMAQAGDRNADSAVRLAKAFEDCDFSDK